MGTPGFEPRSKPATMRSNRSQLYKRLTKVRIQVPILAFPLDGVGEWEMGCFEDDGTHYEDGVRGTITVVAP